MNTIQPIIPTNLNFSHNGYLLLFCFTLSTRTCICTHKYTLWGSPQTVICLVGAGHMEMGLHILCAFFSLNMQKKCPCLCDWSFLLVSGRLFVHLTLGCMWEILIFILFKWKRGKEDVGPAGFMDANIRKFLLVSAFHFFSLSPPPSLLFLYPLCLYLSLSLMVFLDCYLIPTYVLPLVSGYLYILGDKVASLLGYNLKLEMKENFPSQLCLQKS